MISLALLVLLSSTDELAVDRSPTGPQLTVIEAVERRSAALEEASKRIWEMAELALEEHRSAELLAVMVESEGFRVKRGVSDMPTAFVAEWGSGRPVIAFLAEYDALPGLSQKVVAEVVPRVAGGGGHGCGHNLFGAASTGAALALKEAMQKHGLAGTVRLYGTPAEEQGIGKVFMVRDGLFEDVDACLSWHPSNQNKVNTQPSKALCSFEVRFHGRSAHASGAPWEGVSALDAVEAFGSGVNLLREHIPETARIHYVVTEGGAAPNIVPSSARIWAFVRGKNWPEQDKVFRHVEAIVRGADLMAWGEEYGNEKRGFQAAEITRLTGLYDYNINQALGQCMHEAFETVGAPSFEDSEQQFGRELQRAFGFAATGYQEDILPFDPSRKPEPGGSTDVANISWVAPTVDLNVACWPIACPAHSWASTAASGYSAGRKGLRTAAKVLGVAGAILLQDPSRLDPIRVEFERSRARFDYSPAVGPDDSPGLPWHMRD